MYPFQLCKAILTGVRNQLREDERYTLGIVGIQEPRVKKSMRELESRLGSEYGLIIEEDPLEIMNAQDHRDGIIRDDITGQPLDRRLVMEARQKELEYFNAKRVWDKRFKREALRVTGRQPISVRWVDVNKGDDDEPNYRSRLVAREIRKKGEDPIFAPSPPLEMEFKSLICFCIMQMSSLMYRTSVFNSATSFSQLDIMLLCLCCLISFSL